METPLELHGTHWTGTNELWLDPLGNEAQRSDCTLSVEAHGVRYTWSHEGKLQQGSIALHADGAEFTDSWHQPEPMKCRVLAGASGLFQVQGAYGPEADWGWRIGSSLRPRTGELVLQMTNITSWGEEVRAVRMICQRRA